MVHCNYSMLKTFRFEDGKINFFENGLQGIVVSRMSE